MIGKTVKILYEDKPLEHLKLQNLSFSLLTKIKIDTNNGTKAYNSIKDILKKPNNLVFT